MLARLALSLLLAGALAAPARAEPGPSAQVSARKPNKKAAKKKATKTKRKRTRRTSRKKQPEAAEPIALAALDITLEPAVASVPSQPLVLGEFAAVPDPPRPRAPIGGFAVTDKPDRARDGGPSWFIGVRGGPSLLDRRGFYEFRSNRQAYGDERNLRGEIAVGRYLGRRVALGLAGGAGPFPRFVAPDPMFDENTRFDVYLYHARLDLELHRGSFVFAVGGGGAYEYARGTLGARDPDTGAVTMHTAMFRRFGVVAAARTGVQLSAAPFAFEILVEASALKLFRGTYEDGGSRPGLSDREMGFAGSLLLGVRLE